MPLLVLRDWDGDDRAPCAGALVERLAGPIATRPPTLCLRIAVRSIEAWALADHEAFATFFSVRSRLPEEPDRLEAPKLELVRVCGKSRSGAIKRAMLPGRGVKALVGPEYVSYLREYSATAWDPDRAAVRSPSLRRALAAARRAIAEGVWT